MEFDKNIALGILVVLVIGIGAYVYVNTDASGENISVSGNSEISSMPDFASVYILVSTLNDSAEKAKDENAEISEKVLDELDYLGFGEGEVESVSWNLYEEHSWENGRRKSNGYKVDNMIKVEMENYQMVGAVVDRVVDSGGLISSIQFELDKEHEAELKAEALEEATKDAKTKAEAIARGSGGKLGKLVSVSSSDYRYGPYLYYDAAEAGVGGTSLEKAVTDIAPRELSVYGNVQVVYRLR